MNYPSNQQFYSRNITLLYLLKFFSSLYFFIPIWVAFELRYINLSQLAIVEIFIFGSQLILELPTGALADLLGKKLTVSAGLIVSAIAYIYYGFSNSYPDFLFSAFLIGFGASLTSGAEEALLFDTLKQVGKEKTFEKVSSKLSAVFQIGMAIATFVGGYLGSIYFRLPFFISSIALLGAGIITLFIFEPKIDSEKFTLINYIKQTKQGFKELFKSHYTTCISIFYGLVGGLTFSSGIVFSKLVLTELYFTDIEMGTIFASIRIINSFIIFLLVNKTNFFDRKKSFLLFSLLMPIVFIPGIIYTRTIVLPFILIMMALSTLRWILLGQYTNEAFSSINRATAISSLSMVVGIIYIANMLISGPVMGAFNSSKYMITLIGIISVITITPLGIYISKLKTKNISS